MSGLMKHSYQILAKNLKKSVMSKYLLLKDSNKVEDVELSTIKIDLVIKASDNNIQWATTLNSKR